MRRTVFGSTTKFWPRLCRGAARAGGAARWLPAGRGHATVTRHGHQVMRTLTGAWPRSAIGANSFVPSTMSARALAEAARTPCTRPTCRCRDPSRGGGPAGRRRTRTDGAAGPVGEMLVARLALDHVAGAGRGYGDLHLGRVGRRAGPIRKPGGVPDPRRGVAPALTPMHVSRALAMFACWPTVATPVLGPLLFRPSRNGNTATVVKPQPSAACDPQLPVRTLEGFLCRRPRFPRNDLDRGWVEPRRYAGAARSGEETRTVQPERNPRVRLRVMFDPADVNPPHLGQRAPTRLTKAGWLRRPRWGTGARKGPSVSTSIRSAGHSARRPGRRRRA